MKRSCMPIASPDTAGGDIRTPEYITGPDRGLRQ